MLDPLTCLHPEPGSCELSAQLLRVQLRGAAARRREEAHRPELAVEAALVLCATLPHHLDQRGIDQSVCGRGGCVSEARSAQRAALWLRLWLGRGGAQFPAVRAETTRMIFGLSTSRANAPSQYCRWLM